MLCNIHVRHHFAIVENENYVSESVDWPKLMMVEVRSSSSLSLTQDFAEERSRFKFGKLELQSIDKVDIYSRDQSVLLSCER